jgi:hypothetical protein
MDITEWLRKEAELVALPRLAEAAAEIERLRAVTVGSAIGARPPMPTLVRTAKYYSIVWVGRHGSL